MSNHPGPRPPAGPAKRAAHAKARRDRNRRLLGGAAFAALVLSGVVAVSAARQDYRTATTNREALAPTGERNSMGLPVVATPGSPAGAASAGGIDVTGANWDLGRVPLNVAVRPQWTLHNTSRAAVTLGEPKPEVRKGCCPGPLVLGTRTLPPGESTTLTFELSMHPGMEGPHDLGVHLPVTGAAGTEHLVLGVTGDFR